MPARAVTADPTQWQQVADAVYQRRRDLGLTAQAVADTGGISLAVLSQIENARKTSYSARVLTSLARALGWTPDSIDHIIHGQPPSLCTQAEPVPSLEEQLVEMRRRLDQVEALLGIHDVPAEDRQRVDDVVSRIPEPDRAQARRWMLEGLRSRQESRDKAS